MLAALVHTGHASTLGQIHRFTHAWERTATLALRTGDRAVLPIYQAEGRLHACPDSDSALDGVFTHWSTAKADGLDALMLARTRQDVDALNTRARTAAVANGKITGPTVTAGEREWQAGDLLRTRRNNRQLAFGDSHVRNGDRFRVLGPGPTGTGSGTAGGQGLIVEDLAGRGRTILPAEYLAQYCEYGWASTIDSAQGATADLGIVLVRPGMDREHLYVAMTRGRLGNHAYVTPDPALDDEHDHGHGPTDRHLAPGRAAADGSVRQPEPSHEQPALRVLEAALATSGAQDAAHTALQQARIQAGKDTRNAQQDQAYAAERERHRAREQAEQEVPEHKAAREQLQQLHTQRGRVGQEQTERQWTLPREQAELDRTPRRAIRRRRDLTDRIAAKHETVVNVDARLEVLDDQISALTRHVRGHEQHRHDRIEQQRWAPPTPKPVDPLGYLEPSRRARMAIQASQLAQLSRLSQPDVVYRAPQRGGPSRSR